MMASTSYSAIVMFWLAQVSSNLAVAASSEGEEAGASGFFSEIPTYAYVAFGVVVLAFALNKAHQQWAAYADYNIVIKRGALKNEGAGYLNMGLWMDESIVQHYGNDDAICDAIRRAIKNINEGVNPKITLKGAQERMYELFFTLAELKSEEQQVLETGPGTCEHYLYWDKLGLQSNVTCFEKYTLPSAALLSAASSAPKGSALARMKRETRLAETVGANGETYDRIVAVESAFHYPDRADFFKKCFKALKPGGKLIMTDLVANPDFKQNCMWNLFWGYYWRTVLTTPVENINVDFKQYEQQLKDCGFSKVVVIDITPIALRHFYKLLDKYVDVGVNWAFLQDINAFVTSKLASKEDAVHPIKYSFALCVK